MRGCVGALSTWDPLITKVLSARPGLGSLLGVQLVAALGGTLTAIAAIAALILVPRLRRLD